MSWANVVAMYEAAFHADDPIIALRAVMLRRLVRDGASRESVAAELEELLDYARLHGDDEREEALLRALSFLTGWCVAELSLEHIGWSELVDGSPAGVELTA